MLTMKLRALAAFMFVGMALTPTVLLGYCAPPDDGPPSVGPAIACVVPRCNPETITFLVSGASGHVEATVQCRTSHRAMWSATVGSGPLWFGPTDSMRPYTVVLRCPPTIPYVWPATGSIASWD